PARRRTLPADLLGIAQGDPDAVGATAVGRAPREHSRTAIALLVGFLVLVLLLAWRGLSGLGDPFAGSSAAPSPGSRATSSPTSSTPGTAGPTGSTTPTGAPTPVQIQQAAGFDPRGDGSENDQQAGRATDGDPATSWTSETYRT